MPVEKLDDLFDIEIEEAEIETAVENGIVAYPTIDRTITTCAIC
ncbi:MULTISPECIES: hypothetical protein [unclassified Micromonospora]|nr:MULTISPECIES: hypothetical protein [unclassified Micromonospora]MDG4760196.1 hypothetical protein [Micromonospora sp. WMMD710]